jgi:hypothetical protein
MTVSWKHPVQETNTAGVAGSSVSTFGAQGQCHQATDTERVGDNNHMGSHPLTDDHPLADDVFTRAFATRATACPVWRKELKNQAKQPSLAIRHRGSSWSGRRRRPPTSGPGVPPAKHSARQHTHEGTGVHRPVIPLHLRHRGRVRANDPVPKLAAGPPARDDAGPAPGEPEADHTPQDARHVSDLRHLHALRRRTKVGQKGFRPTLRMKFPGTVQDVYPEIKWLSTSHLRRTVSLPPNQSSDRIFSVCCN